MKTGKMIQMEEDEEIFADPTYDITFKMLFGSKKNDDILISLLNSLLDFKDDKKIKTVEINTNELPVEMFSKEKGKSGIKSAVDVLCTTKNNQKIAIEMQGQKTKYFLAREQEYMAKLIAGQVKDGEGKLYHEKVLETYIIVITKENVFTGKAEFEKQKLFEIDVEPRIIQTNEPYPDNKMHWKFFELVKFKWSENYKKINKDSVLKEQWLEFLIECNKQEIESDRNELIKKGYDIMKIAKWDNDTKTLYWKQKQDELDTLEQIETERKEAAQLAFKEGEFKGFKDGIQKEKAKFEVKSEIKEAKKHLNKNKIEPEKMVEELDFNFLKTEDINYIKDHLMETESVIGDNLHLFDMNIDS